MTGRRRRKEILKRSDRRISIGPAGRNLFVSRDKQAQDRAARRIRLWMRVVIAFVIVAAVAAGGLFAWSYLVPYFHAELQVETSGASEDSSLPSEPVSALPVYDSMGLPVYEDSFNLFVINESSPASADFLPELTEAAGVRVDSRIAGALRLMVAAAKEDGLALIFTEGYVPYEEQEKRFEAKVEELMKSQGLTTVMAKTEAKALAPMPGECDAQSGLCVRLEGSAAFAKSKTYSWLKNNMGKYGFVFRYPDGKEEYTGLSGDPTVIRYVGSANAAAMQQRSMCLEEYIGYLKSQ